MAIAHPDYRIHISCPERGIEVFAPLPETFNFDVQAEYQTAWSPGSGVLSNAMRLVGVRPIFQAATAQIWQGTTETALSLHLAFQAETDARTDVLDPIVKLNMLTAAHENEMGTLSAPAAQLSDEVWEMVKNAADSSSQSPKAETTDGQLDSADSYTSGSAQTKPIDGEPPAVLSKKWLMQYMTNKISLRIGRYAFFDLIVPTSVVQTFASQPDANGIPSFAEVEFQFKPVFLLTAQDIAEIFNSKYYSGGTSAGGGAFERLGEI